MEYITYNYGNTGSNMSNLLKLFQESSALYGSNAVFIEDLYEQYLENPDSVSKSWRIKFDNIHDHSTFEVAHSPIVNRFEKLATSLKVDSQNYKVLLKKV